MFKLHYSTPQLATEDKRTSPTPLLATFLGFLTLYCGSPYGADLEFEITGTAGDTGVARVVVFSEQERNDFPADTTHAICKASGAIIKEKAMVTCANLAPGRYAVFAYHDLNENGEMDHNWMRLPAERFGFYRNFNVRLLPPNFDDVAFNVTSDTLRLTIPLQSF